MNTLDEAWEWYEATKNGLNLVGRLADTHWGSWDSSSSIGRDHRFRNLDVNDLRTQTRSAAEHLEDFAVFVLFSVFEGEVREIVLEQTRKERASITHPALARWAEELEDRLSQGSFGRLLDSLKTPEQYDLIEQVNQVRKYRNWVAHGRRGIRAAAVTPSDAYRRLRAFLNAITPPPPVAPA